MLGDYGLLFARRPEGGWIVVDATWELEPLGSDHPARAIWHLCLCPIEDETG